MLRRFLAIILIFSFFVWVLFFMTSSKSSETMKPVKSLAHQIKSETEENCQSLFLYNRIPKTGSTSFMSLLYKLHTKNEFSLAFVNVSSSNHVFTYIDQYKFVKNISLWKEFHPGIFHGHFPYINFRQLGFKPPIYINMIREPLDRLVSHYYFIRYGDTFLPNKIRTYQGDTRTFDQCVKDQSSKCSLKKLWLQIPYFCGVDPECWIPGNKQALRRAKSNVMNNYFLVGITEKMDLFIELLDTTFPKIFGGINEMYNSDGGVHIRKTKFKKPLEKATIDFFKSSNIYKMESEFYEFVKKRFLYIYENSKVSKNKYQVSYLKLKFKHQE